MSQEYAEEYVDDDWFPPTVEATQEPATKPDKEDTAAQPADSSGKNAAGASGVGTTAGGGEPKPVEPAGNGTMPATLEKETKKPTDSASDGEGASPSADSSTKIADTDASVEDKSAAEQRACSGDGDKCDGADATAHQTPIPADSAGSVADPSSTPRSKPVPIHNLQEVLGGQLGGASETSGAAPTPSTSSLAGSQVTGTHLDGARDVPPLNGPKSSDGPETEATRAGCDTSKAEATPGVPISTRQETTTTSSTTSPPADRSVVVVNQDTSLSILVDSLHGLVAGGEFWEVLGSHLVTAAGTALHGTSNLVQTSTVVVLDVLTGDDGNTEDDHGFVRTVIAWELAILCAIALAIVLVWRRYGKYIQCLEDHLSAHRRHTARTEGRNDSRRASSSGAQ